MPIQKAEYPLNAHGTISLRIEYWARRIFGLSEVQIKQTIFGTDQITYGGTFVEALLQLLRTTEPADDCINTFLDKSRTYLGKRFCNIPENDALALLTIVEDALNSSIVEEENK